jgi:hypothetical protein
MLRRDSTFALGGLLLVFSFLESGLIYSVQSVGTSSRFVGFVSIAPVRETSVTLFAESMPKFARIRRTNSSTELQDEGFLACCRGAFESFFPCTHILRCAVYKS